MDANMQNPMESPPEEPDKFNYQLLARLQQDCEYYLGHGNRAKKHLWAGDEVEQIQKMKEIYALLPEKPEWITLERIEQYEAAMVTTTGG
ncbi:LPD11 domain-containing protein [Ottowia sp.]|uniref:LPD11 domain-containing protein n=1 Tax=Ottowia sp. TaxID=1898956 RepID=UPI0025CF50A0|nr:LPD11 domain-containing protein [Ottowia sp.]